jgi:hypothetical protein
MPSRARIKNFAWGLLAVVGVACSGDADTVLGGPGPQEDASTDARDATIGQGSDARSDAGRNSADGGTSTGGDEGSSSSGDGAPAPSDASADSSDASTVQPDGSPADGGAAEAEPSDGSPGPSDDGAALLDATGESSVDASEDSEQVVDAGEPAADGSVTALDAADSSIDDGASSDDNVALDASGEPAEDAAGDAAEEEEPVVLVCNPGDTISCYTGPLGTEGAGLCHGGTATCNADGTALGPCLGEVTPQPESCFTAGDDNCDNQANEGCVCTPNAAVPCYTGPASTEGVGLCHGGTATCNADGTALGPCLGEVTPQPESCFTPGDDNCDNQANEGCVCTPNASVACYDGPQGTLGVGLCHAGTATCNGDGTVLGPCIGEVVPVPESCFTPGDDNCNNQANEGCVCTPNASVACYDGPAGTLGVGLCHGGTATCNADGTVLGPCNGEVVPVPESCLTPGDDNCDNQANEGCVCTPHQVLSCYTGPDGTVGVGICHAGTKTCNDAGTAFGACTGEVTPAASEDCTTAADDNCNGTVVDGCSITYTTNAQPIFAQHCNPCHTTGNAGAGGGPVGSGRFASSYAASQNSSYYCPGQTKGACTIVRIHDGTMPAGAGCTGDPSLDTGKAACLNLAEQQTIQAWIDQGQRP